MNIKNEGLNVFQKPLEAFRRCNFGAYEVRAIWAWCKFSCTSSRHWTQCTITPPAWSKQFQCFVNTDVKSFFPSHLYTEIWLRVLCEAILSPLLLESVLRTVWCYFEFGSVLPSCVPEARKDCVTISSLLQEWLAFRTVHIIHLYSCLWLNKVYKKKFTASEIHAKSTLQKEKTDKESRETNSFHFLRTNHYL